MLLTAVLLDLRIDIFHQRVPLHQHVGEGGTGEDTHHLGGNEMSKNKAKNYKKNNFEQKTTFELRGGNPSKFPANILSTVSSSRGIACSAKS